MTFTRKSEWPDLSLFIADEYLIRSVLVELSAVQLDIVLSAIDGAAIYAAEMDTAD